MLSRTKILSIIITLSLVLTFIAPIGEVSHGEEPRFDDVQTFYLPIGEKEESRKSQGFGLLSNPGDDFIGKYNFKQDMVSVYMEPETMYPMFGRPAIVIRLETSKEETLNDLEYKVTLRDGLNEYVSEDVVIKYEYGRYGEDNIWIYTNSILAYLPEGIVQNDYEISLEVEDISGDWANIIELEKINIMETTEAINEQEQLNRKVEFVEYLNTLESSTNSTFNTGFVPVKLTYLDIVDIYPVADEIVIYKENPSIQIKNLGRSGKIEVKVIDDQGNTVYTTNFRIGMDTGSSKSLYTIEEPFGRLDDYYIYGRYLELYKSDETTVGSYRLIVMLDGEEIYEKRINIVEEYPVVKYATLDNYFIPGDQEFNIIIGGNHLIDKDLLRVQLVTKAGMGIATSIESHYLKVHEEVGMDILYKMKVLLGEQIVPYGRYYIKLTYLGPERFEVYPQHAEIYIGYQTEVRNSYPSPTSDSEIIIEGLNFKAGYVYTAKVRLGTEDLGTFDVDYISTRELSLDMGGKLIEGSYNISLYGKMYDDPFGGQAHLGSWYFHFYGDTGEPRTISGYAYPEAISSSQESYNGVIYIYDFVPEGYDDIEIILVDYDENIVGEAEVNRYKYDNTGSWTEFKMNLTQVLEPATYYYIYKYKGEEMEMIYNLQFTILSKENIWIEKIAIKDSLDNITIPPDKDIEFTIENGLNIEDISKLDIYIKDQYGTKIASLIPNTLIEYEEDGRLNYTGKLYLTDKGINHGYSVIHIIYDEEIIAYKGIILTNELQVGSVIITDKIISSYSDEYKIKLFHPINIDPKELLVKVKDLQGNLINTTINRYEEFSDIDPMSFGKGIDVFIGFNEPLKDAYYELYIYHKGIDLSEEHIYGLKGFYASKNPRLIVRGHKGSFENEDMIIGLTDFIETSNIPLGENYIGKLYLKRYRPGVIYEQEFIGSVDLVSGKKDGKTGILIPSEELIDYPLGLYNLVILKPDGEFFGTSYFHIYYKDHTIINPNDPETKKPSFTINQGSGYTKSRDVSLNISPDGYTTMKTANSMEELTNAEIVDVKTLINWVLPQVDGERTVYIQFTDSEGNRSKILSKSIILDTLTPILGEITLSELENVAIGSSIDITGFGNEKGKAYALFYLKGVEVGKFSLDYIEKTGLLYKYSKSIKVNKNIDKIKIYLEDLAGNKSSTKERNITMSEVPTKTLTVIVKDDNGLPQENKYIYISNYKENFYDSSYTNAEGEAIFQLPSDLDYTIDLYSKGYWNSDTVKLDADKEKIFTIPVARTITGIATIEIDGVDLPVKNANITFTGAGQQYYATTDDNGNYTVDVIGNAQLEVKAKHMLYTTVSKEIDPNIPIHDIKFYGKVKVFGSVKDPSGNPIGGLAIYANGKDNWENTTTNSNGEYELKLPSGEYTLSHSLVPNYESQYKEISINEAELELGAMEKHFNLISLNYDNSFKGDGNNVKVDATTIQRGKTFNLVVNYKNNGIANATGTVTVDLPVGIEVLAGNKVSNFTNLAPGQSGKIILALKVDDGYEGSKIIPSAKISVNNDNFAIGFAELDIIDVTITAPSLVADGNFKIYGEATSGSTVSIIDRNTNQLISIGKVTGKWYIANIVNLPEGEYQLFAKAELNGNIANSAVVDVKVDPINGIKVKDIKVITSGGNEIGMNHEIGIPAFSAWVDMSLKGKDIDINAELSKYIEGMTAEFIFANNVYPAIYDNGRWKANLTNWSGSGTKTIIMKITIGDLIHEFVVGEVIILIDPSGYIYDINTGDRIEGAKATLEKWNGNSWEFWDAELYGQINPQLTDDEGKYGWMVGDGVYRVKIEKNGYEEAIAGNDKSIVIPPPRDDVNIGLKSNTEEYIVMPAQEAPKTNHPWTIEFNQDVDVNSVNPNNAYIMDTNGNKLTFVNPRVDKKKIILDNTGSFTKGKTYTLVIKKTVKSNGGKSLDKGINMKFTVK